MKWIVFILIFFNVAFFLWHYRTSADGPVAEPVEDKSLRLVLLKEYQSEQLEPRKQPEQVASAQQVCLTLGPFNTKEAVAQARQQLAGWGIEAQRRVNKDKSRPGFWVMIPPSESRQQARGHIEQLKANQIKDYFLVATGEFKNAVSLGVFSKPELARRRLETIEAMGFEARLEEVELPLREYWLDWPQGPRTNLSMEQLGTLRDRHEGIGQTQRECRLED